MRTRQANAGLTDADGDGVLDTLGNTPVDSDGDGVADYLDLDSDNDGIPDTVESQTTAGYIPPTNMDTDGDGVDDAYDPDSGGQFTIPVDTDGDGTTDQLDTDSDGDGIHDTIESGLVLSGNDADGDGIDDAVNASYANTDGDVGDPINDLENATDNDPSDVDYRSVNDKDGDGVADFEDLDDDNDGILDTDEGLLPVQLVGDSTVGTNGFIQIAGTGNRGTVAEGDIYIIPNAFPLPDGTFVDLRLEVKELNFSDAGERVSIDVPAVDNIPRVSFRGFDAVENDNVILGITFVESGSANAGSPAGTPVELNNVDVDQSDIEAASNNDNLTEFGSVGNAVDGSGNSVPSIVSVLNPDTSTVIVQPTLFAGATIPGFTDYIVTDPGDDGTLSNEGITSSGDDPDDSTGRFSFSALSSFDWVYGLTGSQGTTNRTTAIAISAVVSQDTDGDGLPDHCDLDSDNDGISDLVESGQDPSVVDTNGDGVHDGPVDPDTGIPLAANGGAGVDPVDSDMDGIDDYLDLDSDDDGIPDAVEAQPTAGYQSPAVGTDTDGDGIVDTFDTVDGHGGTFATPQDTDGDGTPDYLDEDSDNDGQGDIDESGLPLSGDDLDGDGIDDGVGASFSDTDGIIANPSNDLDNETGDTTEVGYREFTATVGAAKEITSEPTVQTDGTYALTYSVVIENTGNVTLNNLTVDENLLTQLGPAFVNASNLTLATAPTNAASQITLNAMNWDGSGTTEIIDNSGTVTSLVAGDSFIVTFDVIINPTNSALDNQVSVSGTALDANGDPYTDALGNPIVATDVSDSGSDPDGINGGENGDTGGSDDATPLYLPAIGLAKEVVSTTPNGDNFDVVYQLVVENTGNVDLADISLVDDLATQFGDAFIGAGSLTFATAGAPPAGSSITLDAGWNGDGTDGIAEMVDQSVTTNVLKPGDSFVVQITVTVDPDATGTSGTLNNQATVGGDAVDDMGNPRTNVAGDPIVTTDLSDSGSDPNGTNPGGDGDTGGSNDPTPLAIPDLRVAKQANIVEEVAGLNGVFDLTYLVVIENTGTIELTDLQIVDDVTLLTNFGDAYDPSVITGPTDRSGLVAAPTIVSNTLADASDLPTLNAAFVGGAAETGIFDGLSGALQAGEQITVSYTIRIDNDELLNGDAGTASDPGNQVTGSANSAIGMVDDLSDDGLNPNTDNGEGTTDDPTPFQVPQVRLFKSQGDAVSNGDGTSTITVTLRVRNSGSVSLNDLSLTEDLTDQFGAAFISTTSPTIDTAAAPTSNIPSTLINSAWAGDTSQDLFDPAEMSELLSSGEEFSITFDVTVDPDLLDDNSDFLTNTADVTGSWPEL